jgi:O-antigen/teichoic acid export membrane protein
VTEWLTTLQGSSARLFGVVVNMVLLLVTAHVLGPAGRGEFAAATTWTTVFATFAGLSLGSVSHHRVQGHERGDWFPGVAGTMFVIGGIMSAVGLGTIWLLVASGSGVFHGVPPLVMAIAGLSLPSLVLDEYGRNLLAASNRVRDYVVAQAVGNAVRLVAVLVALYPLEFGVPGVVGGFVLSQAVIAILVVRAIFRLSGRQLRPNLRQARGLVSGAGRLHLNTVSAFLLAQANILLLNEFATKAEVGWYQFAYQLVLLMLLLPQAASLVVFSKVGEEGPDRAWPWQRRFMLQVLALVALLSVAAAICAPGLIVRVVGHEFEPAARIFAWLLPVVLGMSMAELMAPQWFARGIFLPSTLLTCVAATGNVTLTLLLVRRHGIMGAAWGTAASYVIFVVLGQLVFAAWCQFRYAKTLQPEPTAR